MHRASGVKVPATSFARNRAQSVVYQPISRPISRSGSFLRKLAPECGGSLRSRKPLLIIRRDTMICRFAHSLLYISRNISGIAYTTNLLGLRIPNESSLFSPCFGPAYTQYSCGPRCILPLPGDASEYTFGIPTCEISISDNRLRR